MPLFYFDLSNGTHEPDEDGTPLPSLDDARTEAVRLLGGMLSEDSRSIWEGEGLGVHVLDEARAALFTVRVSASSLFPAS